MASQPPPLHDLEAQVMHVVWTRGPSAVRDVLEALNAAGDRERAYTTVMTTMSRLEGKGLLTRRRENRADIYSPAFSRDEYARARAEAEVGALVELYGDAALVQFARAVDSLDPERRRKLRRLARGD